MSGALIRYEHTHTRSPMHRVHTHKQDATIIDLYTRTHPYMNVCTSTHASLPLPTLLPVACRTLHPFFLRVERSLVLNLTIFFAPTGKMFLVQHMSLKIAFRSVCH